MVPPSQVFPAQQVVQSRNPGQTVNAAYAIERITCALALVALAPVYVAIAATVVILSRRSPLIRHRRVGQFGAPLPLLKFRSMWQGKPDDWQELRLIENVQSLVPDAKSDDDNRVTSRFAAFCRRHSIDELPQLWHVVRGEMSLVGPRPITALELELYYGDCARRVLEMRPGLAGLWQVMGRNRLTYRQRRRLDLFLVEHASAGLYLRILAKALPAVLTGKDAY
ncbi:MAG TPA: sugar transferase [Bryobacteraceae bacterium]|nr:sugar transferase [Bryobacteraceae bacterium]